MSFCHSEDQETFRGHYETREEALEVGRDDYPDATTIYTGEAVEFDRARIAQNAVDRMLEWIGEDLDGDAGEVAEGQPDVRAEDEALIVDLVRTILSKPGVIRCWSVEKIQEHTVTLQD